MIRKARGTEAAKTAVGSGDWIGALTAMPYDGSNFLYTGWAGYVVDGAVSANSAPTAYVVTTGTTGGGSERFRITSTGNVGIGTTAPSRPLEVQGAIVGGYQLIRVTNNNSGSGGSGIEFKQDTGGGTPFIGGSIYTWDNGLSAADMIFTTQLNSTGGSTEKMRITAMGNVGIGTTAPLAPLDVYGNSGTTTTTSTIATEGAAGTANITVGSTTGFPASGVMLIDSEAITYSVVNATTLDIIARAQLGSTGAVHSNGATVSFVESLVSKGATTAPHSMTMSSGNVLIGTMGSATSSKLTVGGDIEARTSSTNAAVWAGQGSTNKIGLEFVNGGGVGAARLTTRNNFDILFTPNNVERMRIKEATGLVGIGTAAPAAKLDVRSDAINAIVSGGAGIGNYGAVIAASSRGTLAAPTASQAGDALGVFGSYGYGATAFPALPTAGMIAAANQNWTDAAQGTLLIFRTTPDGSTTAADRMTIAADGKVGFGTNTPSWAIHSVGNLAGQHQFQLQNTTTGAGWSEINVKTNAGDLGIGVGSTAHNAGRAYIWNYNNTDLNIGTNNTERMVIEAGGDVGVGVTNPATKLQVAGVISAATDNTYTLGSATYRFTSVHATNGTIQTSDRREKKDIYNTDLGLDFINMLRPVSYRWNTGVDNDVHYGLIAQETEKVIAKTGNNKNTSIITHDKETDRYGVRYSELIAPLIKAVQEVYAKLLGLDRDVEVLKTKDTAKAREIASIKTQAEVEKAAQAQEIEKLKKENAAMKARLDKIEKALLKAK